MNILNIINEEISLLETGEGTSQPYPYEKEESGLGYVYRFNAEGDNYEVQIARATNSSENIWDLSFDVEGKSSDYLTNKNVPFRIMSTVAKITQEFVDSEHPDIVYYFPIKQNETDLRREKLYLQYIVKAINAKYNEYDVFKILYKYSIEKKINNLDVKEIQKFLDHLTTTIKLKVGKENYMISHMSMMQKYSDATQKSQTFRSARAFYADYLNELSKQEVGAEKTTADTLNEIENELVNYFRE